MKKILILVACVALISCGSENESASGLSDVSFDKMVRSDDYEESMQPEEIDAKELVHPDSVNAIGVNDDYPAPPPPPPPIPPPPVEEIEILEDEEEIMEIVEVAVPDEVVEEIIKEVKPNHASWDAMLKKNVSSSGKVNYDGLKGSLPALEAYIKQLEGLTDQKGWSRNEKLAYWINMYNAATVRLILKNYPVTSITKINGGKPWDLKVVTVGSKKYTLNEIENSVIRPKFKEPRIHFAVNCAAKSCPKLLNGAFLPDQLSRQLTKMTKAFIDKSGKNEISEKKVKISKIFEWYADDFKTAGTVQDFLNKYSATEIKSDAKIEYLEYNWDLNK